MIGSSTSPIDGLAPNSSLAIGTPDARVFLDAQNTVAISSGVAMPSRRAVQVVRASTTSSRPAAPRAAMSSTSTPLSRHRPAATPSQKAVNTNITITQRSSRWVMWRWRTCQA